MMGQVIDFWRDDGISIPPRPRRIEPMGDDGDRPPVLGFILIYVFALAVGFILGGIFS